MNETIANKRWKAIEEAGLENLRFVMSNNNGDYYRVQGPTFVIVSSKESDDHYHTIWRDYDGDWGEDLLERHLELMHNH